MLTNLLKGVLSGIVWAAAMTLAVTALVVCLGLMTHAIAWCVSVAA